MHLTRTHNLTFEPSMENSVAIILSLCIFVVPTAFLALFVRHFIPLIRGTHAPVWAYALGPFLFFTDKYLTEAARPHRKTALLYCGLFIGTVELLFLAFGK